VFELGCGGDDGIRSWCEFHGFISLICEHAAPQNFAPGYATSALHIGQRARHGSWQNFNLSPVLGCAQ
jgi:hypothetical protein